MITVIRLDARSFDHTLSLTCGDDTWTAQRIAATAPLRVGKPYRGYVRLDSAMGPRFGYVASRSFWVKDGEPVADGLLYEVSPSLRFRHRAFPRSGRRFRQISEALVANDERQFDSMLLAFL